MGRFAPASAVLVALLIGCAGTREPLAPPAPTATDVAAQADPGQADALPPLEPAEVLALIEKRWRDAGPLNTECTLTFHRPDGDSLSLNAALVARPPEALRLRAWKLGRAVLDLTLRRDGTWIWTAKRASDATEKLLTSDLIDGPWAAVWPRLGGLLSDPAAEIETAGGGFVVRGALAEGGLLEAEIDAGQRVLEEYRLLDEDGKITGRLRFAGYRDIDGEPWPTRLVAENELGRLEIEFDELVFGEDLPATAFEPPPRAERRR